MKKLNLGLIISFQTSFKARSLNLMLHNIGLPTFQNLLCFK